MTAFKPIFEPMSAVEQNRNYLHRRLYKTVAVVHAHRDYLPPATVEWPEWTDRACGADSYLRYHPQEITWPRGDETELVITGRSKEWITTIDNELFDSLPDQTVDDFTVRGCYLLNEPDTDRWNPGIRVLLARSENLNKAIIAQMTRDERRQQFVSDMFARDVFRRTAYNEVAR